MNRVIINVNGQSVPGPRVVQDGFLVRKKLNFMGGLNYNKTADVISDFFIMILGVN